MATHSSILAWENPMDAGVWQVHGFTRVRHDLAATAPALTASVYTLKRESGSRSVVAGFLRPHELYSPWNSPGQNTGVGNISFSRGSSQTRDQTQISHIAGRFVTS